MTVIEIQISKGTNNVYKIEVGCLEEEPVLTPRKVFPNRLISLQNF